MTQLLDQLGNAERDAVTGGIRDLCGAQLIEFHGLDVNDPGPPPQGLVSSLALALDALQEPSIVLDGLHRQGEGRELRRAPIHIRPVQVLLQDQACDPPGRVPGFNVHLP